MNIVKILFFIDLIKQLFYPIKRNYLLEVNQAISIWVQVLLGTFKLVNLGFIRED